jgi:hypothetical protein
MVQKNKRDKNGERMNAGGATVLWGCAEIKRAVNGLKGAPGALGLGGIIWAT